MASNNADSPVGGPSGLARLGGWDQGEWEGIEVRNDEHTQKVNDAIAHLGDTSASTSSTTTNTDVIKVLGDLYETTLRKPLIEARVVDGSTASTASIAATTSSSTLPNTKKGKGKVIKGGKRGKDAPKELTKKEKIIMKNTIERVRKGVYGDFELVLESLKRKKPNCKLAFHSPYAEFRLAGFMCMLVHYIRSKPRSSSDRNTLDRYESDCSELIVGVGKALFEIKEHRFPNVSALAVTDLEILYTKLIKTCHFKIEKTFQKFPRLCISTDFDKVFPHIAIKPYPSQVALMDLIKTYEEFLIIYQARINGGKTSTTLGIPSFLKWKRQSNQSNEQLLFVCSSEAVRTGVASAAWNTSIPFGVAHVRQRDGSIKKSNNYNCRPYKRRRQRKSRRSVHNAGY